MFVKLKTCGPRTCESTPKLTIIARGIFFYNRKVIDCRVPLQILLQFDFYVDTCGEIELHQCIDSFVGWINDIHQTYMRANFELVA